MSLKRIITLVFYAIVVIVATVGFVKIFSSDALGELPEVMLSDPDIVAGTALLIMLSVILVAVIVFSTFLASPILGIISNPKGIVKSLIGAAILLVIFFISYAMADDTVTRGFEAMGIDTPGKSQLIGGVITTVFALIVIGIVAYIFSSINSLLKQL